MPVLPLTFRASALPIPFKATPQQFLDAIVARLSIESEENFALFVTGSVAPTSNVGPWLKDGVTWYVWDDSTGAYIPEVIEFRSLRYVVSETAPDQAVYTVWIQTDSNGVALAIKTYSNGAWNDVYSGKFATIDTAIAKAYNTYPVVAKLSSEQTVPVDTSFYKIQFDSAPIDPNSCFDAATFSYTAPVSGIYEVSANFQINNDTAIAATMEMSLVAYVNDLPPSVGPFAGASEPSPNGARWYPTFSGLLQVNVGDKISVYIEANDGTNTGNIKVAPQSRLFIHLIRAA